MDAKTNKLINKKGSNQSQLVDLVTDCISKTKKSEKKVKRPEKKVKKSLNINNNDTKREKERRESK